MTCLKSKISCSSLIRTSKFYYVALLLVLVFSWNNAHAQLFHITNRIAYDRGVLNASDFTFNHYLSGNEYQSNGLHDLNMATSGLRYELGVVGGYLQAKAGIKWRFKHTDKNFSQSKLRGKFGNDIWFKMSFGGMIKNRVGIYLGGQLQQGGFRGTIDNENNSVEYLNLKNTGGGPGQENLYYKDHFGDWEYGLGGHLLFNIVEDLVVLRATYEYNWLSMKGIPRNRQYKDFVYTGRSFMAETELYFFFSEDDEDDFGLSIQARYVNGSLDFSYSGSVAEFVPQTNFNHMQLSLAFHLPVRTLSFD